MCVVYVYCICMLYTGITIVCIVVRMILLLWHVCSPYLASSYEKFHLFTGSRGCSLQYLPTYIYNSEERPNLNYVMCINGGIK